jgi:uncharacterized protein (TIGR03435 family)
VGPFLGSSHAAGLLHMQGSKVQMANFARELALILDRPVIDRTGFLGEFDLELSFKPDSALKGLPSYGDPGAAGPNIVAALENQLGLKLVPSKGPVEVLVVDHADRPL